MRKLLTDYPDEPTYNMKAVEQQTEIPAATLRAWERRYRLMEPKRTANGYRLYSDRDVALLRWVRDRMAEGLTISRVVAMLEATHTSGEPIWIDDEHRVATVNHNSPTPPEELVHPLYQALIELDDVRAGEILEQAFALYSMSTVYIEIIVPALIEIGEAWHRGEVLISTEHFATGYLRGRLLTLLQAYTTQSDMPKVFIACAPSERHEIGALIFAIMLRQHGYNVIYLGQDLPIEDLVKAAEHERPTLICVSATSPSSALLLRGVQEQLAHISAHPPLFAYAGHAFDVDPALREAVPGHYLGEDPRDALIVVNNLLHRR